MPLSPIVVSRFGPLRLDADPGDVGFEAAIDLLNIDFDPNGTIRPRPGYDQTDSNTLSTPIWLVRKRTSSQYVLLGGSGVATNLRAYNGSTFASADTETIPAVPTHAIEIGDSSSSYIISTATGTNSLDSYFGGGRVAQAIGPASPKFLASWQARLVMGQTSEANAGAVTTRDPSIVRFSEPNNIFSNLDDDFIRLDPNDGEQIRMVVPWREMLFVFKESKFYVFFGTSTDSAGGAIFNYRAVNTGVGASGDFAVCAAQDGVYFVHTDGVYRTVGGPPERVSAALQPFFDGLSNGYFSAVGPLTSPRIHAGDDRLYVWQQGATTLFVMDFRSREWTYWQLSTAPYALLPLPSPKELIFADSSGRLHRLSPDFTDDDGGALASHYLTGFQQLADGRSARVRKFDVTGTGSVTHTLYGDRSVASEWTGTAATNVTLGTTVPARGVALQSGRARQLAFKASAASGVWTLSSWQAWVADVRSR